MTISVVGAGFGRTGTLSLKLALEQLGLGPCYHMVDVIADENRIDDWAEALTGKSMDWAKVFKGYQSLVDWPAVYYWKEITDFYPEAKVVLSLRNADSWYDSVYQTIYQAMQKELPEDMTSMQKHRKMTTELIMQLTFHGKFEDREYAKSIFEKHNQEVQETISPDRLLVFEAKDGWGPLCEFLGCDVPEGDYPRVNSTDEFRGNFKID